MLHIALDRIYTDFYRGILSPAVKIDRKAAERSKNNKLPLGVPWCADQRSRMAGLSAPRHPPEAAQHVRQRSLSLLSTLAVHESQNISPTPSLKIPPETGRGSNMTANLSPQLSNMDLGGDSPWGGKFKLKTPSISRGLINYGRRTLAFEFEPKSSINCKE